MSADDGWIDRCAVLHRQANLQMQEGHIGAAWETIEEALGLAERDGDTTSSVFAALMLTASDVSRLMGEHEASASMAKGALERAEKNSDTNIQGAAWMRLALCDMNRGYRERAIERFHKTLALLPSSEPSAPQIRAEVYELLNELAAGTT